MAKNIKLAALQPEIIECLNKKIVEVTDAKEIICNILSCKIKKFAYWIEVLTPLIKFALQKKLEIAFINASNIIEGFLKSNVHKPLVKFCKIVTAPAAVNIINLWCEVQLTIQKQSFNFDITPFISLLLSSVIDFYMSAKSSIPSNAKFNIIKELQWIEECSKEMSLDVLLHCKSFLMPPNQPENENFISLITFVTNQSILKSSLTIREFLKLMLLGKRGATLLRIGSKERKSFLELFERLSIPSNFAKWAKRNLMWTFSEDMTVNCILKKIDCQTIYEVLFSKNHTERKNFSLDRFAKVEKSSKKKFPMKEVSSRPEDSDLSGTPEDRDLFGRPENRNLFWVPEEEEDKGSSSDEKHSLKRKASLERDLLLPTKKLKSRLKQTQDILNKSFSSPKTKAAKRNSSSVILGRTRDEHKSPLNLGKKVTSFEDSWKVEKLNVEEKIKKKKRRNVAKEALGDGAQLTGKAIRVVETPTYSEADDNLSGWEIVAVESKPKKRKFKKVKSAEGEADAKQKKELELFESGSLKQNKKKLRLTENEDEEKQTKEKVKNTKSAEKENEVQTKYVESDHEGNKIKRKKRDKSEETKENKKRAKKAKLTDSKDQLNKKKKTVKSVSGLDDKSQMVTVKKTVSEDKAIQVGPPVMKVVSESKAMQIGPQVDNRLSNSLEKKEDVDSTDEKKLVETSKKKKRKQKKQEQKRLLEDVDSTDEKLVETSKKMKRKQKRQEQKKLLEDVDSTDEKAIETSQKKKRKQKKQEQKKLLEDVDSTDEKKAIETSQKKKRKRKRQEQKKLLEEQETQETKSEGIEIQTVLKEAKEENKPPTTCQDSDSDLEILENSVCNNDAFAESDKDTESSEVDEASGSDGDIEPCDEENPMFTTEETKEHHKDLSKEVEKVISDRQEELKKKMKLMLSKLSPDFPKMISKTENTSSKKIQPKKVITDFPLSFFRDTPKALVTEEKEKTPKDTNDLEEGDADSCYGDDKEEDLKIIYDTIENDLNRNGHGGRHLVKQEAPSDEETTEVQFLKKSIKKPLSKSAAKSEDFVSSIFNIYNTKSPKTNLQIFEKKSSVSAENTSVSVEPLNTSFESTLDLDSIFSTKSSDDKSTETDTSEKGREKTKENDSAPKELTDMSDDDVSCVSSLSVFEASDEKKEGRESLEKDVDFRKNLKFDSEDSGEMKLVIENSEEEEEKTSRREIEEKKKETEKEVKETEEEVKETEEEVKETEAEVQETEAEVQETEAEVQETEAEVQETEAEVQETEAEVQETEEEVQETEEEVQETEEEVQETEEAVQETEEAVQETEEAVQETEEEVQETPKKVKETEHKKEMEKEVEEEDMEIEGKKSLRRDGKCGSKTNKADSVIESKMNASNHSLDAHNIPVQNGRELEDSRKSVVTENVANKENIVNNKQGEEIEVLSFTGETSASMTWQKSRDLILKSPLQSDVSTYASPKKIGSSRKRGSLDGSIHNLTPLKVSNAALNNEIIISPDISDEEHNSKGESTPVEKDVIAYKANLEEEQVIKVCDITKDKVSPVKSAKKSSRKSLGAEKRKITASPLENEIHIPLSSEEKQLVDLCDSSETKESASKVPSRKSTGKSSDKSFSNRRSIELSSSPILKSSSLSDTSVNSHKSPIKQEAQVGSEDDVVAQSTSNSEEQIIDICTIDEESPATSLNEYSSPKRSLRSSNKTTISDSEDLNSDTVSRTASPVKIIEETTTRTSSSASGESKLSEEQDTLSTPVKSSRYLLRRLKSALPEQVVRSSPRTRRSSLSSIKNEDDIPEASVLQSPSRPRARRNSTSGPLTPLRRSRRIGGLVEEPLLE